MTKKYFNKSKFVFSVSLFILGFLPFQLGRSECGIWDDQNRDYSFVIREMAHRDAPDFAAILMPTAEILAAYEAGDNRQIKDNIWEWRNKLCDIADSADVREVIYVATIDDLSDMLLAARAKNPTKHRLSGNVFADALVNNQCTETIEYLIFAKKCEPLVTDINSWDNRTQDQAEMYTLIGEGEQAFRRCSSPFIQLRYAYQVLRLAHYVRDYPTAMKLYNDLIPRVDDRVRSVVRWWILGHRAGILQAMGKRAEAGYYFSLVFKECPSKRESAFRSFDIRTEEEWKTCLNFCKTASERATLHAIRASGRNVRALGDLKSVYQLDPKNEFLTTILLREVLRMEKIFLGNDFRVKKVDPVVVRNTRAYVTQLRDFIYQVAKNQDTREPRLWFLMAGYTSLFCQDYPFAWEMFKFVRPLLKDELMIQQVDQCETLTRLILLKPNSAGDELTLIRNSEGFASNAANFEGLMQEKMASMYEKSNRRGVAFLCRHGIGDLYLNPKTEILEDLIATCQNPNKTVYEQELVKRRGTETIEPELIDMRGTEQLLRGQLEAALVTLEGTSPKVQDKWRFTPFVDGFKECVHCLHEGETYTKTSLIKKILELEFQARTGNDDGGAPQYYQIGLAFYNMTYFGPAWKGTDYYRSGSSWWAMGRSSILPTQKSILGNRENFDCRIAAAYFEKARTLTRNLELGARATFWAAKCERNAYYTSPNCAYRPQSQFAPKPPPQYQQYFQLLNSPYYQKTTTYQQAIAECKFFALYARR